VAVAACKTSRKGKTNAETAKIKWIFLRLLLPGLSPGEQWCRVSPFIRGGSRVGIGAITPLKPTKVTLLAMI